MGVRSFKSYGKINIALSIKGKREDGYHELDSIMVPIELHDSLIISPLVNAKDNFITVDDFSNGLVHYDLVGKCINGLAKEFKFKNKYRVYIHKNIPMQAGLGGGSSNAAFTLKAVNHLLKLGATDDQLINIASKYGADIPFFIKNKPARCRGIGEKINELEVKNNYWVLLVKPNQGISTKEAFALCDKKEYKQISINRVELALEEGSDEDLARYIGNSMLDAALQLVPEIQNIFDFFKSKGLKIYSMSGSGSTCFALSRDKGELKRLIPELEDKYFVELTRIIR